MDARRTALSEAFNAFLARYSPPRHMQASPETMQAEADALFRVVMKFAPSTDYENWLDAVLEQLAYQMKTRAWPTVHEVGSSARNISRSRSEASPKHTEVTLNKFDIMAGKVREGLPVGDGYLYGKMAVEMVEGGYILETELTRHRSALFFGMRDAWGEERALEKEAELKRRHETAKAAYSEDGGTRQRPDIPRNKMPLSQDARDEYRAGGW